MSAQLPHVRPLGGQPDHGRGALGQLAHLILSDCRGVPPPGPQLHLGLNTLPDPPQPAPAAIFCADLTGQWQQAPPGGLAALLAQCAQALRSHAIPDGAAFSESQHRAQRLLRFDSIALACAALEVEPTGSVEAWTAAADVLAGRRDPRSLDPRYARPCTLVWVVDRSGTPLLGRVPAGAAAADIALLPDALLSQDRVISPLGQILAAQYAWTCAVFGTAPASRRTRRAARGLRGRPQLRRPAS